MIASAANGVEVFFENEECYDDHEKCNEYAKLCPKYKKLAQLINLLMVELSELEFELVQQLQFHK